MLLDISPLRVSRDYRLLFFGQVISFFGSMMTFVVVPWQMHELTGSNAMVGYIYFAEFVPMVILAFVGGALADFFDKRRLLRMTEFGQAAASILLLVNSLLPQPRIWVLFVCVAMHAGLAAIQRPAFESFIQQIIPAEMMAAVMALNSIRFSFGAIISMSIAGIVAAKLGPTIAYAIDLVTFTGTISALFMVAAVPSPKNADRPSLRGVVQSLKYALARKELLGTYLIDFFAMFFAMPQALYPALADHYGEIYLGLFPAAIAAGALLAGVTSGWTSKVQRHGLMVTASAILWGVAIIFFGFSTSVGAALLCLAAGGFFDMISGVFRGAIWNQTIPNFLRGRMASLEMISYLSGPMLGSAKMGIVAEYWSVRAAIISGGVLCVIAVAAAALMLPSFLTYDGREGIKQKEFEEAERNSL
jgi:MFS family permease